MKPFAETVIEQVQDLSFSHNRETVDVHVFDKESNRLTTIKNVNADTFLDHFEYGTTISEDKEKNIEFLKIIL